MRIRLPVQPRAITLVCLGIALVVCHCRTAFCQNASWAERVRDYVTAQQFDAALGEVDARLRESPADLEARGWRGRLLAWRGQWAQAESEYRTVLHGAPSDAEIMAALSDVLVWQGRPQEALPLLDHARALAPTNCDILLRRAHVLQELGDLSSARAQIQDVLRIQPRNPGASKALQELRPDPRHELHIGTEIDTFTFADAAQAQTIELVSRWTPRWASDISVSSYQRFTHVAGRFSASGRLRFTPRDWLTVGGAVARMNAIIPNRELLFEHGHGFRFENSVVNGVETLTNSTGSGTGVRTCSPLV